MSYKYAVTIDINEVYLEEDGTITDVDSVSSRFYPATEPVLFDSVEEAEKVANRMDTLDVTTEPVKATECVFPMVEECLLVYPTTRRVTYKGEPV